MQMGTEKTAVIMKVESEQHYLGFMRWLDERYDIPTAYHHGAILTTTEELAQKARNILFNS